MLFHGQRRGVAEAENLLVFGMETGLVLSAVKPAHQTPQAAMMSVDAAHPGALPASLNAGGRPGCCGGFSPVAVKTGATAQADDDNGCHEDIPKSLSEN